MLQGPKGQGFFCVLLITVSPALSTVLSCCGVDRSCPVLWSPMDCSTPGFPVLGYLLEFAETRVHWIGDAFPTNQQVLAVWSLCSCSLTESCLTLCDPVDCSPPSFPVHGLSQAQMLKWAAISFSRDLPDPGIEPASSALAGDSLPVSHLGSPLCLVLSVKEKKCCPVFSANTDVTAIGLHITDVLPVSPEGSQDRNRMPGI